MHDLRVDLLLHDGVECFHPVVEVADAQCADFAFPIGLFKSLPCTDNRFNVACGMVEIHKIEILDSQTVQHLIQRLIDIFKIAGPELARKPDFFARNTAVNNTLSDTALIQVSMCIIQMPIIQVEGRRGCFAGCLIENAEVAAFQTLNLRAKTKLRHLHSVVQSQKRYICQRDDIGDTCGSLTRSFCLILAEVGCVGRNRRLPAQPIKNAELSGGTGVAGSRSCCRTSNSAYFHKITTRNHLFHMVQLPVKSCSLFTGLNIAYFAAEQNLRFVHLLEVKGYS